MKRLFLAFCLSVTLVGGLLAAPQLVGDWSASNGHRVTVPVVDGNFTLVFTGAGGARVTHPAQWTEPGEVFTWTDKQGTHHTVTFEAKHNPPRYKDVNEAWPDSPAYWYQVQPSSKSTR